MTPSLVGGALGLVLLMTFVVMTSTLDIDGSWTAWSVIGGGCSAKCGGGTETKIRNCNNPAPHGDGNLCTDSNGQLTDAEEEKQFPCNTQVCFSGNWSDWGNCSETCGRGQKVKNAMCGDEVCIGTQTETIITDCNSWNKTDCPNPCDGKNCPDYAVCRDDSTDEDPIATCVCTMGFLMNLDKTACVRPPPTTPTPRPIPTLPPEQKVVATVLSKTASILIIIMVCITLALFLLLRVFTPDRVIQMNMEIALVLAHVMLMFPPSIAANVSLCRLISILVHLFFTACFMFMMLEALHMYSLVAFVVKKNGFFSKVQNTLIGWGTSLFIVLCSMCFEFDNYGGEYHCWLRMNTPLVYGQFIPIITIIIITFTLIEAAGAADYKQLKGMDSEQLMSAKISQRTNLVIMPLVFSHWMVGMLSEYEQNLPLYGTFSILNGVTGVAVFLLHCSNNQEVRAKLKKCFKSVRKGK